MADDSADETVNETVDEAVTSETVVDPRQIALVDDTAKRRFEVQVDGTVAAFTNYRLEDPTTYAFTHTSTQPAFAGQGLGTRLVRETLEQMRAGGFAVLPYCPFWNGYLRKHPDDVDLVPAAERRRFGLTA
jgi:predicted GNAT family acetyltransferase